MRFEAESYETMVQHLEREMKLYRLAATEGIFMIWIYQIDANNVTIFTFPGDIPISTVGPRKSNVE